MFTSDLFNTSNLFTRSLLRRITRSAAALAMLVGLSSQAAFADGNYLPDNGGSNGWNGRPSHSRSLGNYEVERDSMPPHRGGSYRSNYRPEDGRDLNSAPRNRSWNQRLDLQDPRSKDGNDTFGDDSLPSYRNGSRRPQYDLDPVPATIPGDRSWRDRIDRSVSPNRSFDDTPFNNGFYNNGNFSNGSFNNGGFNNGSFRNGIGRDSLPFDNSYVPALRDQLPSVRPQKKVDERPQPAELINRRYSDPAVLGFIAQLNPQQGLTLYGEVLELIQNRHLEPPQPAVLVRQAQQNLILAMQNPAFAQANRLTPNQQQVAALQQAFAGMSQQMNVSSNQQAVSALQWTMQAAQQTAGINPSVTAVEFIYGAIDGLDRFSAFVPPETAKLSNQQLGESVVGVGVQIEVAATAGVKVVRVIANSPAATAGLQKNDLIVAVNGQSIAGRSLDAVTQLITGPEGTMAVLTVQRNQMQASFNVPRRSIQVQTINDVQFVDQSAKIGYFKLDTFASASAREMEAALWQLHQQGMQGLVLDLRGDPGGLLTTAIETADMFLPSGTIVSTRGRTSQDNSTETAREEQTWKVPLVVLIDDHSASASEIFAAAIQENGRGIIVGRHSYGKGTVQTLFPLNSLPAGLRLTTARFYSPSGRPMAGEGVEPDVYVAQSTTDVGPQDRDVQTAIQVLRSGATPQSGRNNLGNFSAR